MRIHLTYADAGISLKTHETVVENIIATTKIRNNYIAIQS